MSSISKAAAPTHSMGCSITKVEANQEPDQLINEQEQEKPLWEQYYSVPGLKSSARPLNQRPPCYDHEPVETNPFEDEASDLGVQPLTLVWNIAEAKVFEEHLHDYAAWNWGCDGHYVLTSAEGLTTDDGKPQARWQLLGRRCYGTCVWEPEYDDEGYGMDVTQPELTDFQKDWWKDINDQVNDQIEAQIKTQVEAELQAQAERAILGLKTGKSQPGNQTKQQIREQMLRRMWQQNAPIAEFMAVKYESWWDEKGHIHFERSKNQSKWTERYVRGS